jgi:hypothetical protein
VRVLAVAAVTLAVAADSTAARKDPCTLVTAGDAKAALGGAASTGSPAAGRL